MKKITLLFLLLGLNSIAQTNYSNITRFDVNEIVKSYNKNILELKTNTEELKAVNIFDENKNLVKTILQEQYIHFEADLKGRSVMGS